MKIAIDLTALADNFTGIERFTLNIAHRLVKNSGTDEFILIFKKNVYKNFEEFENYKNVQIIVLKERNKLWFTQITLALCMYRIRADRYLFLAFPAPLIFLKGGTISAIHDIGCWDCPDAMTLGSRCFFRTLFYKSALMDYKIITVSEFSKERIRHKLRIKDDQIVVIYNGLDQHFHRLCSEEQMSAVRQKYGLPEKYVLCLSTLEPRKNMRLLIDACCSLWDKGGLEADLVLAGRKGWKISNLLNNLDESAVKRIHLTGFIEDEDLPLIYRGADVFVFPSLYEGFGIPPLEALAAGTDVISSDGSSLPEVLGEAAIYFQNNKQIDLECKLSAFYREGLRASGKLPRDYDWEVSAKNLRRAIE